MKEGIHPNYPASRVSCACGNSFVTRSTRGDLSVDICSACHPFYTGTQKLMDTAGRVDRFRRRYATNATNATNATGSAKPAASKAPAAVPAVEPDAS
jgi:large subunit ribosomal protein L31